MENEKKKLRDRTWFVVIELLVGITAISGYGVIDMFKGIEECRVGKIKKKIDRAAVRFNTTENDTLALEVPIRLFREVYEDMPEDETGYKLLLERARAIIWAKEYHYNRIAEKLLEEAVGLSEQPYEAQNLLESLKRLKP